MGSEKQQNAPRPVRGAEEQSYPYLKIGASQEKADLLSAILLGSGALGLEKRDGETMVSASEEQVVLVAWFDDLDSARAAAEHLESLPAAEDTKVRVGEVEDPGWAEAWRDHFRPMRFGQRLWVTPPDEGPTTADDGSIVTVRLLPSGAFGTGTHESTAMMLEWIEELIRPGMSVLDVGCGSGVLSLAAVQLGARHAWGIDIDPEAVFYACENSDNNDTNDRCTFDTTPLQEISDTFDIVLANLSAPVLIAEKERLAARVAEGGTLVWSGLLESDLAEVGAPPELVQFGQRQRDDWVAQTWSRRGR